MALWAAPAAADRARSAELNDQAKAEYADGNLEAAIATWHRAHAEYPAPEYLYNVAQGYRRLGRCSEALAHYGRYLVAKPDAANRAAVEARVTALRAECDPAPDRSLAAAVVEPPAPRTALVHVDAGTEPVHVAADAGLTKAVTTDRSRVSLALSAGPSFITMGDVVVPVVPTVRLAGHVRLGRAVAAGVTAALSPIPYRQAAAGTALLTELVAEVRIERRLSERWRVHASAGPGVALLSRLAAGNPFVTDQQGSGILALPTLRLGGAVEVALGESVFVTLPVGVSASLARGPLHPSIDALVRFELLAGLEVRR